MNKNRGTEWQNLFKNICEKNSINCIRFYDTMQGFKSVDNPCDFVISKNLEEPSILVECKSTHNSSFGLDFKQYPRLLELNHFRSIVLIWFVEKKKVCALDIQFIKKLRDSGVKSYNPDKIHDTDGCMTLDSAFARIKPQQLDLLALWGSSEKK